MNKFQLTVCMHVYVNQITYYLWFWFKFANLVFSIQQKIHNGNCERNTQTEYNLSLALRKQCEGLFTKKNKKVNSQHCSFLVRQ